MPSNRVGKLRELALLLGQRIESIGTQKHKMEMFANMLLTTNRQAVLHCYLGTAQSGYSNA
jgi:hypothetical protein